MKSKLALLIVGCIVAEVGLSACDDPIGHDCTLIGCFDGLQVDIRGLADTEYEVVAEGLEGESRTGECVVSSDGTCRVMFVGFYPSEVTLSVTGADQQVSVKLQPAYEESQPNGPDCPPTCRNATVAIDLRPLAQLSYTRLEQTR